MLHVTNYNVEEDDVIDASANQNRRLDDSADGSIPQEKDGFLSRKVGYEIERRLVKAVQVRTLRKKRQNKGHYHYYPFYEKENYSGIWGWIKRHLLLNPAMQDENPVYGKTGRRRRRRRHHKFCMKCVTSSFQSLFKVLKEPLKRENVEKVEELMEENGISKESHQRALSRADTNATRTPTPKMLFDMKSGAIHWPVYQFGGQSGSGMLLSAQNLVGTKKKGEKGEKSTENAPGRENFSLGEQLEIPMTAKTNNRSLLAAEEDEKKLIGWLQVRDPRNRKKTFLQVVNPKPEGPFRKAPWHGNVHVMKF